MGSPGEGVCMALSAGVLSQKGPSELEPGSGWALALGWSDPPGSRAELLLLALFCLSRGMVSGPAVGIPLGLSEFSLRLSVLRSWPQAGVVSEEL